MAVRNRIQVRRGYSMGYSGSQIGDTPVSNTAPNITVWQGSSVLYEGEIGYEIDTGKFKIGRKDPSTGSNIIWENLDYGGGGTGGGFIAGTGIGIYVNVSGDDTIYSVITNSDSNLTIEALNLSGLIPGTTGTYYNIGLADNLNNINNITISGDLAANDANFSGNVVVSGNISVSGNLTIAGTGITFPSGSLTVYNLEVTNSGNFGNALTVGGTGVSLEGHTHSWSAVTDLTGFCDDVANCVDTQFVGSSGVQLIYTSGDNILRVALSGESLAQHLLNTTGFIARSGANTYVTRSIVAGSNIVVDSGNGIIGNPRISLSGTLTGLTAVTATTFNGELSGNSSSASQVATIQRDTDSNAHYLTFVDANNNSSTNETVYTASGIRYIPSTDTLIVGNISGVTISGTIAQTDKIKTIRTISNSAYYITFVDSNNSSADYENVYTGDGLYYNPSNSGLTVGNNLIVGGNLTVNGTTVTANVDSMVIEDPMIVLGRPSGTIVDDSKDRGIEIVWSESSVAKTGFFGWDRSANEFIAARDVTISDNTVSNITYLDARFKDIDGSIITASSQFDGPGSGLSGTADSLEAGKAKNLSSGTTGSIPYQSNTDTTTFLSIGTSGQFLRVNNGATAPYWDTLTYTEIGDLPTIGSGTLTIATSGSGLGLGVNTTFGANQTGDTTITVTSNATDQNTYGTIVSRDSSGNFSATTITANLSGTATNAENIEVDTSSSNVNHLVFVNGTNGNLKPSVNSNLKFDAANNILYGTDYSSSTSPTSKIEYFIIDGGTP